MSTREQGEVVRGKTSITTPREHSEGRKRGPRKGNKWFEVDWVDPNKTGLCTRDKIIWQGILLTTYAHRQERLRAD